MGWQHHKRKCRGTNVQDKPCGRAPSIGRNFCRIHGGAVPIGKAHYAYRNGLKSRYKTVLPDRLAESFEAAMADEKLLSLRREISISDARIIDLWQQAREVGYQDDMLMRKIDKLVEQRRKLVDSEHKRLQTMGQLISKEQLMLFLQHVSRLIEKNVKDSKQYSLIISGLNALAHVEESERN